MKVVVVGTDPGALCSALALDRDGHQVLVVGCHGGPQSGYERADLSVLKRGGILGGKDVPDAFERQIQHRRVRFDFGASRSGFSFDPEGSLPTLFRRKDLREWLLREVRSTDVHLRPTREATGLLRRDRTVVGITTRTDDITGDVVYLSENGFAWLTRNEEYGSSLPGDEPPHIVNLQAVLPLPTVENRSESLVEFLQSRTVTTLLGASDGDGSSPPLAQVFPVRDRCVVDLYLTRELFRARGSSPATLMDDVLGRSPLRELPTSEDATLNLRLQPLGGWSRRATLCDHGLALGGAGAGFINLWPDFDTVGPALRSGYQFARTITHLDRQGKFPGRDRLREFYERPLSQGRLGREMRRDEPLAERFENTGSLTARLDLEELEPPGPSSVPSVRTVFDHLQSLNVSSLKSFLPGDWIGELEDLLQRVIRNRINPFSGSAGLRFHEGDDMSRTAFLALRLTGRLWKRCHRLPEEPSTPDARTTILPYFLGALDALTDTESRVSPETPPGRDYRMSEQSGPETTPKIHATVQNSLQANLDSYQEIEQQCPAGVFGLSSNEHDQREFDWNGEDCVHCGLCRFGSPGIDFYGTKEASTSSSDKLPEAFQASVRDLFAGPDSSETEDGRDVPETVPRRLDRILESLRDEAFLTPESRDWIDGQLNLIRSDLNDLEELEIGRDFIDCVREEIGWIRRLLSREQYRFAHEKLRTLQRYHRELTSSGDGASPTSPETPSPVSKNRDSDAKTTLTSDGMHRVVRKFYESLRSRIQERLPSTKEIQGAWSVGFLRPGRSDRISTLVDGEVDRILLNTEFGPRIFIPPEQPSAVPVQLNADLRVHWYKRNDLQPVESDGFVPDDFSVTVAPFLVDYFDFFRRLIRISSGDIVENTFEPLDLRFGRRQALTHQLELLKNQESAASEQLKLPVVGRLLAGTDAVLESLYGSGSTRSVDPHETSEDLVSLIRALSGSPGDLVREQRGSDGISEDLVNQLSLSEEEQERWEMADTSGIIHDSVRQWRTTLGVLRGLSRNDEGTDLQRLLLLVRTGTTRRAIGTLQEKLDRGESPRFSSLSLKLLMKRLFWARQPFENPDLGETNPLERKAGSPSDQPPSTETVNELILGTRADVRSIDTSGIFSDLLSYLRTVLEELRAERIPGDSLVRELSLLLGEFREILEPELRRVATAGTGPGELLVLGPLLRWLNRFNSRMDELDSGRNHGTPEDPFRSGLRVCRDLGIHFWKGLRTEPLRERVMDRTEEYRNNFPFDESSVLEERTRETLRRSLEFFVIDLSRRPNLVGLWSEYVRLIGRMQRIDRTIENGGKPEGSRIGLHQRVNQDVQNRSKLFNHGVRELRNDREPPASQILDLFAPSSIFPRRHTGEV